jgi:hypothetical protein
VSLGEFGQVWEILEDIRIVVACDSESRSEIVEINRKISLSHTKATETQEVRQQTQFATSLLTKLM